MRTNEALTIARYVRLEKVIGRSGDWLRIARVARHVSRACRLYGYPFNPY